VPTDDFWQALDIALTLKRTRQATLATLNHLMKKRFPHLPDEYLTQDNCDVWGESLTAGQLQQCNPRHSDANPRQLTGPVVVFEHEGQRYMFDGTNRLNVWLRDGNKECHDAIIIKRKKNDG
jgi:hypothetical protein